MIPKFDVCIQFVLYHEGGRADDKDDSGGLTHYGISSFWRKKYPDFFRNPTLEGAKEIYKLEFWNAYVLDELPVHIAVVALDMLVNHNPNDAVTQLQRGAGGLLVDGMMGRATRAKLSESGVSVSRILQWRQRLYQTIVDHDPSQIKFFNGWAWRTNCLNRYSLGLEAGITVHPNGELV